ncbi:DUF2834 domain-containing protein [Gordonia sp. LSe1-13]|uniref:DUF2834 domain-containing protein n=1 Tax=Gordonia sesuvii TaxID=3116777 RepID=A0ABU7M8J8_9ACTN|nr:DUF2834 domain-containing protein [Gordonia sp. LSe1-13]
MVTSSGGGAAGGGTSGREKPLFALFIAAFIIQNAIALPYVRENGLRSTQDFFVGDILKTTPGRFALVDLGFVSISFHIWAFAEARRLRIVPWWIASFVLTCGVGIATAVPFFLLVRDRAIAGR